MFAVTKEKGQLFSQLDVCKTPVPSAPPVPTPYPNMAMPPTGNPAAKKVIICGMPALTKASKIRPSNGDQPGVALGIKSSKIMGAAEFITGSSKVKIEGKPAVFLNNMTKHNEVNAVGSVVVPSQNKVMIMA